MKVNLEHSEAQNRKEVKARLECAAERLLNDYSNDKELTAFTALDGEEFHAQR
jgi:hypothetical protein